MRLIMYLALAVVISFILSLNAFRFFPPEEINLFITIIGLIYGLMAAFVINHSWERFSKIRDAISEEKSSLINLHSLLGKIADRKTMKEFAITTIAYCKGVIDATWEEYPTKKEVHDRFERLFDIVSDVKIKSKKEEILYEQSFEELREASTSRTHQIVLVQSRLSSMQWALLLFLSAILVISITFLALPFGIASIFISTFMISAIVIILLVIFELNSMKYAEEEVSIQPYKDVIRTLGNSL